MDRSKILALSVAISLIAIAGVVRWSSGRGEPLKFMGAERVALGEPGSEHSHSSLLIFINGSSVDFSVPQFQEKNEHIHFEDSDGITIHKHAKGATLDLLLRSLGMELSSDCITLSDKSRLCTEGNKVLRSYLNREAFVDWANYELRGGDKILIDYGETNEVDLGLRLNAVPDLPEDL